MIEAAPIADLALLERLYRSLYRIRRVEEEIARVYPSDKIMSPVHLSIGQEAISVGVCEALAPQDVVYGSYRSHALYLARGGDLRKMIAELYGKAGGCAKGKAGSMHLIDTSVGAMGASAVVATTIPQAVGHALAISMRRENGVVASFFGDGAVEEGVFHESLNFAALRKLPVVFICENNDLAIHSRQSARQATCNICDLARAHGVPAERFDGMDVVEIFQRVGSAVSEMRSSRSGPQFFECPCDRWREHVGPGFDFASGYRDRSVSEAWQQRDEMERLAKLLDPPARAAIDAGVEREIKDAFEFAEQSPFPDDGQLYADLYAAPGHAAAREAE